MEGQYPSHIAIVEFRCAACQVTLQETTHDGLCSCRGPLQPVCTPEQGEGTPDVPATQWPIHHRTLVDQGDEIALQQSFASLELLHEWVSVNRDAGTISDPSVATPDGDVSTIDGVEAIDDEETYDPHHPLAGDQQYYTDDESMAVMASSISCLSSSNASDHVEVEFSRDEVLRGTGTWSQ